MIYIDNIGCSPFDNQFGFRKGSSTDQCIFMLKERIRRYVDLEGPVYCYFLDASKAFDRVCHSTLFLQLIEKKVHMSLIMLLKYWYDNQTMYTAWNGVMSTGFRTSNGVRQGGLISPYLFNIYVDLFSERLSNVEVGCYLNCVSINHLIYADDLCLLSPSISGLGKLLNVCETAGDILSIKFNKKKILLHEVSVKII